MTSVFAFFILICVLVAVHEYGHFWAARRCGVRVLRFSIGFGKVLYQRTDKHGTEWAFSLIPLGGYVKMLNDEPEGRDDERYDNKSVWARMFIVLAGPLANFLFAVVAYWVVFLVGIPAVKPVVDSVIPNTIAAQAQLPAEFEIKQVAGRPVQDWEETMLALVGNVGNKAVTLSGSVMESDKMETFTLDLSGWKVDGAEGNPLADLGIHAKRSKVLPFVKSVSPDTPAAVAGVEAGDEILRINDAPFDWQTLISAVQTGKLLALTLQRAGKIFTISPHPVKSPDGERWIIGITPQAEPLAQKYRTELKYDILTAFTKSLEKVGHLTLTVVQFVGKLLTGDLSLKNMGGPISMAKGAGVSMEIGAVYYLSFMALISVNLGVMNLFPLLPLDGGLLALLGLEAVRKKAISDKVRLRFQQVGMVFVLGLMLFALGNDLIHF